jgi:hypothetical protein
VRNRILEGERIGNSGGRGRDSAMQQLQESISEQDGFVRSGVSASTKASGDTVYTDTLVDLVRHKFSAL